MAISTETKKAQFLKKNDTDGKFYNYHFETESDQVKVSEAMTYGGITLKATDTLQDALKVLANYAATGGQASTDLTTHKNDTSDTVHGIGSKISAAKTALIGASTDAKGATTINGAINYAKYAEGLANAAQTTADTGVTNAAAAQAKADAAYNLANGQSRAYVFENTTNVASGKLTEGTLTDAKIGDNILIKQTGVSDFWISAIATSGTASTSDAIASAVAGASVVVVWNSKYYTLTALEGKTSLAGYLTEANAANTYRKITDSYTKTEVDTKDTTIKNTKTTINGDISVSFTNAGGTVTATLPDTGVAAGTYSALSVDKKGRVTGGAQLITFLSALPTTTTDTVFTSIPVGGIVIVG